MVTGIVNLAPESLPTTVIVVCNLFLVPNNVLTVVAVKFTEVPITVLETFVGRDSGARITVPVTITKTN